MTRASEQAERPQAAWAASTGRGERAALIRQGPPGSWRTTGRNSRPGWSARAERSPARRPSRFSWCSASCGRRRRCPQPWGRLPPSRAGPGVDRPAPPAGSRRRHQPAELPADPVGPGGGPGARARQRGHPQDPTRRRPSPGASWSGACSKRPDCPRACMCPSPGGAEAGSALTAGPERRDDRSHRLDRRRPRGRRGGRSLKRVSLELGGSNALIVLDDADIDVAASAGAWSAFLHQGQVCMTVGGIVLEAVAGPVPGPAGGTGGQAPRRRPEHGAGRPGTPDQRAPAG